MNTLILRVLLASGSVTAMAATSRAQVIELRATINAAQEVPASTSPATGAAVMLYDVAANTYDLMVTINNLQNTATASHLHEAPAGTPGGVVSNIGSEAAYTRTGNTVTGAFHDLPYGGDKLKLLQGGAYFNLHSAAFPGGEVRGQLIARPKRLYANVDVAQEQAAMANPINSNARGAAVMWYDPGTGRVSLRVNLYRFANTLTNSHFHDGPVGVSGPVSTGLGGASAYTSVGTNAWQGVFDIPYTGDPLKLLTGGAYLNFHSNVYAPGEIRGQVWASEEVPASRLVNVSSRGQVGSGSQALIQGFQVLGPEPVRVLITARGPSLAAFGVTGVLADPMLTIYDASGQVLASNNDVGTVAAGSELASIPGVPTNSTESALVLVLPPGLYTVVVSGAGTTTGTALLEVYDLRASGGANTTADDGTPVFRPAGRTAIRESVEWCELPSQG